MSRRRRTTICPACALRWRLDRVEADRHRWMAEATREGRRQLRTFWHPYTDDAPEAMIEMTDCDPVAFLRRRGFAPNLSEAGLFRRAYEEKRPFNNPKLGCLRHEAKSANT